MMSLGCCVNGTDFVKGGQMLPSPTSHPFFNYFIIHFFLYVTKQKGLFAKMQPEPIVNDGVTVCVLVLVCVCVNFSWDNDAHHSTISCIRDDEIAQCYRKGKRDELDGQTESSLVLLLYPVVDCFFLSFFPTRQLDNDTIYFYPPRDNWI